jgi:hypothetical protein
MGEVSALLPLVLVLVLAAEFTNGWNDAPNAIATVVSTRVLLDGGEELRPHLSGEPEPAAGRAVAADPRLEAPPGVQLAVFLGRRQVGVLEPPALEPQPPDRARPGELHQSRFGVGPHRQGIDDDLGLRLRQPPGPQLAGTTGHSASRPAVCSPSFALPGSPPAWRATQSAAVRDPPRRQTSVVCTRCAVSSRPAAPSRSATAKRAHNSIAASPSSSAASRPSTQRCNSSIRLPSRSNMPETLIV